MKPPEECLHIEVQPAGPQWQSRVRFLLGRRGALQNHGTLWCSNELASLLLHVLPGRCGRTVTAVDRRGPEPVIVGSVDERV